MMDLRDFRFLEAVAETGSVTRAAGRLGCVQSNVTTRLRKLEDRLGQKLVERIDGRMVPTAAGVLALDYGARIVRLSEEAEKRLRSAAEAFPPLRLGTMETTAAVRLPPLLKAVRAKLPDLRLSITTGTSGELVAALGRGDIDLALVAEEAAEARFASVPLFEEELVEVLPVGGVSEAAAVVFRAGCCYRARFAETFGDLPVLELGTLDGIMGCVAAGLGRTLLPEAAVERWRRAGEVETRPLDGTLGRVRTLAMFRPSNASRRSIDALIGLAAG
ncbi:LysR substrate-binding domain-containing protein [Xanthobacter aminoxidans]|uniref:LysR substrate-binding domain-containing protein n=1 Tax=Xanthobacter aminoxidans TaxID=186280 RepID=UPI003728F703|nr:LysR substrate-binding domain-containing protein [Xanthobacter aminoxidans]